MIKGPEFSNVDSANKPQYLMVQLHGWGSNGDNLLSVAKEMSQQLPPIFHFCAPNGPHKYGYGYEWFSLEDRTESVIISGMYKAAREINAYIDAQLAKYALEDKNLILGGFSQGAMMAMHIALRRQKSCCAVLSYSGRLIAPHLLYDQLRSRPPIILLHGTKDTVVPFFEMEKAYEALKQYQVPVKTCVINNLAHSIDNIGVSAGTNFVRDQLGLGSV